MTNKQKHRQTLIDLRDWVRLEYAAAASAEARKAWKTVEDWAIGEAKAHGIDLSATAAERIARQREIFP